MINNLTKILIGGVAVVGLGRGCISMIRGGSDDTTPHAPAVAEPAPQQQPEAELSLAERLSMEYSESIVQAHDHAIAVRDEFLECRAGDIYLDARESANEQNIGVEEVLITKLRVIRDTAKQGIEGKVRYSTDAEGNDAIESPSNDVAAIMLLLRDLMEDQRLDLDLHCEIDVNPYWASVDRAALKGIELLREHDQGPVFLTDVDGERDE